MYLRGVYSPVEIGNRFKDGQYLVVVVSKGHICIRNACNVALKIIQNDDRTHELEIMRHLRDSSIAHANVTHGGRKFVVQLLDDFDVSSTHRCLVLEVMGRSIASYAEQCPGCCLPRSMAKKVMYQVALGLDYLWKCHVAHGDLHWGNVLFAAPIASTLEEKRLKSYLGEPDLGSVQRLDGRILLEPSVPSYLVRPKTFRGYNADLRIVDLGGAFFHNDPPRLLHTPVHMRAPEALFNRKLSPRVDMWSMGCLLFGSVTGRSFANSILADESSTIEEIQSYIGAAPVDWINQLDVKVRKSINGLGLRSIPLDRYLRIAYDQDEAALVEEDEENFPVEEYEKAKREFTDAELDTLSFLLLNLLTYDPTMRYTPEILLQSQFFEN
ncbi:kinase-like protein [Pseudovirgaria hyperparasitica]|uniref:Kinase-like protein n=1 Tax=Pseudovirgaria hyperparasitica TaxID=470096 RepID=A0A6A6WMG8_9PEZI|nr:kinase-like protein [Pseudovirgaria hyperparasitica]KAF2763401.1 kinase-like protein [Pseudovirgaria hyperparasitica]